MAPPANQTALTAVDLGSFPIDFTQTDINDAGVNYTVWYKFTAPVGSVEIGLWAFSGVLVFPGYIPIATINLGPAGAPVAYLGGIGGSNVPMQFPVTPGTEYFVKCLKNMDTAGPEQIRVRAEVFAQAPIRRGDILINDDGLPTDGFPLAAVSGSVDNEVRQFVAGFAEGEAGDTLDNGIMLWEDYPSDNCILYNPDFSVITSIAAGPGANRPRIRTCIGTQRFLLVDLGGPARARIITAAGATAATYSPNVTIPGSAAIANDESIIYIVENAVNSPIKQFDTGTLAFIADLVAGIASYLIIDILVLSDGTLIVSYEENAFPTANVQIKHYSAAGATLHTYNIVGTDIQDSSIRLATALDDPASFWVTFAPSPGLIRVRNIRITDGVTISEAIYNAFSSGEYNADITATPERFGVSPSCPFMVMRVGSGPGLYILTPSLRNDIGEAIPTPTFKTALVP